MNKATHRNGCHNRAPFRTEVIVQDGWRATTTRMFSSRDPVMVSVPFPMARDCQYTHSDQGLTDKACIGCNHRAIGPKA